MATLPFFPLSEDIVINVKQVKMFRRKPEGGWEVYFDRADPQPVEMTEEQYMELCEMMMEKKEEKMERRMDRDEQMMSRDARRFEMTERALRRMGI